MKTCTIFLFALTFIFSSCNDDICEKGQGRSAKESYSLRTFDEINISAAADVEIIKGSEHKFEIEAQPNVLDRFRYHVKNKGLYIDAKCFNSTSNPRIKIFCTDLKAIKFSGAGEIHSASFFEGESFTVNFSGTGKIDLKGEMEHLNIRVSGAGDLHLGEFKSKNCDIKISGVSDCEVHVEEKLKVQISGTGNVYYTGHPEINQTISGAGKVESRN